MDLIKPCAPMGCPTIHSLTKSHIMASQRQSAVLPGLITTSPPSETIRQSPVAVSDGALVWPLKDKNEERELKRESERQTWFQDESNNILDIPNGYLNVFVLLIRWHEDIDEFKGHGDEVSPTDLTWLTYYSRLSRLRNLKPCSGTDFITTVTSSG
jgi:hypothetical protein